MHGSHAHFNRAKWAWKSKDAKKPITIIYIIIPIIITIIQNDRHPTCSHHDHHHHHHRHQNHHHHHSEWLSSNIIIMHYIIIIMSRTLYAVLGAIEMTAPLCFQFCRLPINSEKATAFLPQWTYFHAWLTGQSVLSERVLVPLQECPKAPARVKTVWHSRRLGSQSAAVPRGIRVSKKTPRSLMLS